MKLSALLGLMLLCACAHGSGGGAPIAESPRPGLDAALSRKAIPGSQGEEEGLLLAPPPAAAPAVLPRDIPVGTGAAPGKAAPVPAKAPEAELAAPAPDAVAPAPELKVGSVPALSRTDEQRVRDERCAACCAGVKGTWRYGSYSLMGDYPVQYGCCEGADWKPTAACREAARVTAYFGGFGEGRKKFRCPAGSAQ